MKTIEQFAQEIKELKLKKALEPQFELQYFIHGYFKTVGKYFTIETAWGNLGGDTLNYRLIDEYGALIIEDLPHPKRPFEDQWFVQNLQGDVWETVISWEDEPEVFTSEGCNDHYYRTIDGYGNIMDNDQYVPINTENPYF